MTTSEAVEINLHYRPSSYFWPHGLEKHLLARVKGAERKAALKALIAAGRIDEVPEFLAKSALSEEERQAIGRIHPAFMGGEYLPDLDATEVEIARISIKSTTGDVTSLYARRGKGCIHYRVVDEYGGDTLTSNTERTSEKPLSLGELYEFFVGAWPFMDVLEMNYEDDVNGMLGFFRGTSEFYGEFDVLLRERVCSQHPLADEEEEEDGGE
jgi:hypothetical protein